jgi:uncharacterized membrane protein
MKRRFLRKSPFPESDPQISTKREQQLVNLPVSFDFVLIVLVVVIFLSITLINEKNQIPALNPLQWVLAFSCSLFIPGYALHLVLFPSRNDLTGIERLGISVGLSITVVPLLALLLDQLPWGISTKAIAISLTIVNITFSLAFMFRRIRTNGADRYIPFHDSVTFTRKNNQGNEKYLKLGILTATAFCIAAVAYILFFQKPENRFTEFYILGDENLVESLPREVLAGQPIIVKQGIHNLEGNQASYYTEIYDGDTKIGRFGPFDLKNKESIEFPISVTPITNTGNTSLQFFLYRDGISGIYRSLKMEIKIISSR